MSVGTTKNERFRSLVEPHLDALHRTAKRLTRDESDADDLLQETLLKSFRALERFEPDSNFRAWIFKILTNTFINEHRRRKRGGGEVELDDSIEAEGTAPPEQLVEETEGADMGLVLQMVDERLRQAVMDLPDSLRTVFVLAVLEELKYREIADILDCPVGTVMSRLFRARAMLKQRLEHYAVEEGYLRG